MLGITLTLESLSRALMVDGNANMPLCLICKRLAEDSSKGTLQGPVLI